MTPSDDLSPPRRPIFFPVVIATVFLTIIGMTGGFVLGERHRNEIATGDPTTPVTGEPSSTAPEPPGPSCPPETVATAKKSVGLTELYQVLKVETDNGTTVWICQDLGGKLYYQGKTGGLDAPMVEHDNALFLSDVRRQGADDYLAHAPNGTDILVSRRQVEVRKANGKTQTNRVVSAE